MILKERHRAGIRVATNFNYFRDDLIRFDRRRFRGLGEKHTARFVAHVVGICDSYDFSHYNGVLYIMKAMCFLGSHMFDDPRFPQLDQAMRGSTRYGDMRVQMLSQEVEAILTRFAGPKLKIYHSMLSASLASLDEELPIATAGNRILTSLPLDTATYVVQNWQSHLYASAKEAADALGFKEERSRTICLGAAAILGFRFYRDPLYPWVQDLTKDSRSGELERFLKKRIVKQLQRIEAHYGL